MDSSQINILVSEKEKQILLALLYFDVFNYPLNQQELSFHCKTNNNKELGLYLSNLIFQGLITKKDDYYFTGKINTEYIVRREKGNKRAIDLMRVAQRYSKKMFQFPFVHSINISGSLSKNYFDENSDIDYFIIAKKNRVWICRTFLILYWKLLPKSKKKYWCTNYFIDESISTLEDQNYFTAVELSYLIPTVNAVATENFYNNNAWLKQFVDNKNINKSFELNLKHNILKKTLEFIFNGRLGNKIENYLHIKTIKRWREKFSDLNDEDFELQFRSRKDVSKRHTKGFQNKVLDAFNKKIENYNKRFGIELHIPSNQKITTN